MSGGYDQSRGAGLISLLGRGEESAALLAQRAENRARSRERRRAATAERSEWRLWLICVFFLLGYAALGGRMALLAASEPAEPRIASATDTSAEFSRAPITDRRGQILATNLPTWAIYAHPTEMKRSGVSPQRAAERLAAVLPGTDIDRLADRFARRKGLVWVKRPATPAERQAVHDLGIPGIHFGQRETRIYPAGRIAAHILGGARVGEESVTRAELVGRAGVERTLDGMLRDPAREGAPLALSVDLTVQTALTRVMEAAMTEFRAKAAAATLMDANTGEIIALVSLPDFDPNNRPNTKDPEVARIRPMMNRAAEGVYELGSTFKLFTAAQAIDEGIAGAETMIETKGPLRMGRHKIGDFHKMPPIMSLRDVIVESSNVGTSRLALVIGAERQRAFLEKFGFLDVTPLEIAEAGIGRPLLPKRWGRLETMTISFGHGFAATQLHLAAAYAALVNGGLKVKPTLLMGGHVPGEDDRIISAKTSRLLREMLRAVVAEEKGTGNFAEVPGYEVGGKTGTADKPSRGGYDERRTLSTFAGAFPMSDPKYVLVVTLDEAKTWKYGREWRTAGWTAAPTAGIAVKRIAPLLGMRPLPAPIDLGEAATAVGNF
ncbi:MAG: penicillin-binding protein 2 [Pseudomonadota bacterium]